MPNYAPPSRGYERSNHLLGRSNLKNPLRDFLKDLAKRDRVEHFYEFMDWSETTSFTLAQTQTSVSFTVVDGQGGVMAGTAVGASTANISAIHKTRLLGNCNPEVEFRWKINTIVASYIVEAGLVDAAPATGAAFVADIDTANATAASFVGTNGAVFGIWSNQTHANFAFASIGSFTSQTVASTLLTTSNSAITAPTADTYVTVTVGLYTPPGKTGRSVAYAKVNGRLVASHVGTLTGAEMGAVNGQTALYPWINVQGVTTVARIFTVDYIRISHDRAALGAALE
jgi:hypothetical protein